MKHTFKKIGILLLSTLYLNACGSAGVDSKDLVDSLEDVNEMSYFVTLPKMNDVLSDATPRVLGAAQSSTPGSVIEVTSENSSCAARVSNDGSWSCELSPALSVGSHIIKAKQFDRGVEGFTDEIEVQIITDFISEWSISLGGTTIELPLTSEGNYNFTVDYGDGSSIKTVTSYNDFDAKHTYASAGLYTITIQGLLDRFSFAEKPASKNLIKKVVSLGSTGLKKLDGAFKNCLNLELVEAGEVSQVNSMHGAFENAIKVKLKISNWDTSISVVMSKLFSGASEANPDVSQWNMSNTWFMDDLFKNAVKANPDVSQWDTSSAFFIKEMFSGATKANPDVSQWDLGSVYNIENIFNASNIDSKNYYNFLIIINESNSNNNLDLGTIPAQYNALASSARASLINKGWLINDQGQQ